MRQLRLFSMFMMVAMIIFVGISTLTVADEGAIRSEQQALDALNRQFGGGFIQNPGPGPGYQVSGGDQNPVSNDTLAGQDPFGDGVNGGSPFPGVRMVGGCQFDGTIWRDIQEAQARQINGSAFGLIDPSNIDEDFSQIFGSRPVRANNDQPN